MAIIRPDEDSQLRPVFNWLHRLCGMTASILGCKYLFLENKKFELKI